jgi:hypothetical protein
MYVSNLYLRPFYTRNRSQNRNLEQYHGSGSGSDRGKMIQFRRFQLRLRLRYTILEPRMLSLEKWGLFLEVGITPQPLSLALKAQPGMLGVYHRGMEAWPGAWKITLEPWRLISRPRTEDAHPGAMKTHTQPLRLTLQPWKINLEQWSLTLLTLYNAREQVVLKLRLK